MTRRGKRDGAVMVAMCDCPSMTSSLPDGRGRAHSQSKFCAPVGVEPTTDRLDAVHDQQWDHRMAIFPNQTTFPRQWDALVLFAFRPLPYRRLLTKQSAPTFLRMWSDRASPVALGSVVIR